MIKMYRNEDKILDTACHDKEDYPEPNKWIIVKDKDGTEYHYHKWLVYAYYDFILYKKDDISIMDERGIHCSGWVSNIDIVAWKYDYYMNNDNK